MAYTAPPLKLVYRGLGEMAVALGFGPIMLLGAYVVQTGRAGAEPFVLSLVPGILIALILYVNEIPDRRSDAEAGKRTLPVRLPPATITTGYLAVAMAAFGIIVVGVVGHLPVADARRAGRGADRPARPRRARSHYDSPYTLMAVMGANVNLNLVVGGLLLVAYVATILVSLLHAPEPTPSRIGLPRVDPWGGRRRVNRDHVDAGEVHALRARGARRVTGAGRRATLSDRRRARRAVALGRPREEERGVHQLRADDERRHGLAHRVDVADAAGRPRSADRDRAGARPPSSASGCAVSRLPRGPRGRAAARPPGRRARARSARPGRRTRREPLARAERRGQDVDDLGRAEDRVAGPHADDQRDGQRVPAGWRAATRTARSSVVTGSSSRTRSETILGGVPATVASIGSSSSTLVPRARRRPVTAVAAISSGGGTSAPWSGRRSSAACSSRRRAGRRTRPGRSGSRRGGDLAAQAHPAVPAR